MRILLCDDGSVFLEHFSELLRDSFSKYHESMELLCVQDGATAYQKMLEDPIDVAFLDIDMPRMDLRRCPLFYFHACALYNIMQTNIDSSI